MSVTVVKNLFVWQGLQLYTLTVVVEVMEKEIVVQELVFIGDLMIQSKKCVTNFLSLLS